MKRLLATIAALLIPATIAVAVSGVTEGGSGTTVWVLAGLFGLIITLQLMPALTIAIAMVRVLREKQPRHAP